MGSSHHKVEKIKVAGWTYMAACGLDPTRRDSLTSSSNLSIQGGHNSAYDKAVVMTMVEFAAAMMMQLQNFNRGSFQSFEGLNLRIGVYLFLLKYFRLLKRTTQNYVQLCLLFK